MTHRVVCKGLFHHPEKQPSRRFAGSAVLQLENFPHALSDEVDYKTAALLLYALQTASMNLKRTSLEPALPTQVVIDRESVANRPIGASAWSRVEGREYDDLSRDDPNEESDHKQPTDSERLQ